MNILSLFDGMSCGQQALNRAGIKYEKYFASEIDKYAIKVTQENFPNTIQLGSVVNLNTGKLPKIDLLIGGSPCQSFSFAGKRKGMSTKDSQEVLTLEHYLELKSEGYEFEGQSYLFWEYMRILKEVNPKYFLLENVQMSEKWERVLSKAIGVNPIKINSSLVSAQNRIRLYWTNIGMVSGGLFGDPVSIIEQPKERGILLKDILESEVNEKYFLSEKIIKYFIRAGNEAKKQGNGYKWTPTNGDKKSTTIVTKEGSRIETNFIVHNTMPRSGDPSKGGTGPLSRTDGKTYCLDTGNTNAVEIKQHSNSRIRRLTPTECERLQTVEDGYTNHVSDTQRYKMLGNGWTVDVIVHIFSYIQID